MNATARKARKLSTLMVIALWNAYGNDSPNGHIMWWTRPDYLRRGTNTSTWCAVIDRGLVNPLTHDKDGVGRHFLTEAGSTWVAASVDAAHVEALEMNRKIDADRILTARDPRNTITVDVDRLDRLMRHRDCGHDVLNTTVMNECEFATAALAASNVVAYVPGVSLDVMAAAMGLSLANDEPEVPVRAPFTRIKLA